jgi:hypothetical protein
VSHVDDQTISHRSAQFLRDETRIITETPKVTVFFFSPCSCTGTYSTVQIKKVTVDFIIFKYDGIRLKIIEGGTSSGTETNGDTM